MLRWEILLEESDCSGVGIRSSDLDMLSLKCLLDIQVELLKYISVKVRKMSLSQMVHWPRETSTSVYLCLSVCTNVLICMTQKFKNHNRLKKANLQVKEVLLYIHFQSPVAKQCAVDNHSSTWKKIWSLQTACLQRDHELTCNTKDSHLTVKISPLTSYVFININ